MDSSTERQRAEYWEKGWKRLVHHAWRVLGPMHPLSLRISRRLLRAAANASLSAELERVRAQLAKARRLNYSIDCASLTVQRDNAQTQLTEARKEADGLREELRIETHKVITCGVAASHPDAALYRKGAYGKEWDSPQAEEVRKLRNQLTAATQRAKDAEQELAELLEDAARQACHTGKVERDYMGQVAGTLVTDSGAISDRADMLRRLATLGKFRIVGETGRMVVGYWPENDPQAIEPV